MQCKHLQKVSTNYGHKNSFTPKNKLNRDTVFMVIIQLLQITDELFVAELRKEYMQILRTSAALRETFT